MKRDGVKGRHVALGILAAIWVVAGIAVIMGAVSFSSPATRMAGESSGAVAVFIAVICAAAARKRREAG
ncbi:MAG: hypothetical protein ACYTFG_14470 [Planctomycetota bacterium]